MACRPISLAEGKPTYRRSGLTPEILANQLRWGHISQDQVDDPGLADYIGLVDCAMIGQRVMITWPDGVTLKYLVVDCRDPNLPPYPDDLDWVLAAEFDRAHWFDRYDWGQFARREAITVWTFSPGHDKMSWPGEKYSLLLYLAVLRGGRSPRAGPLGLDAKRAEGLSSPSALSVASKG